VAQDSFVLTRDGYNMLKAELDRLEDQQIERQANFANAHNTSDSSHEEAAEFEVRAEWEDTR